MKYLGFIKEYNDIKYATKFANLNISESILNDNLEKIIAYLQNGEILLAWMGYIIDINTKELIAPNSYYTDGIWVWPSYLPYYLNKYPNMSIDKEFVKYLKSKNFKMNIDESFKSKKNELEKELSFILNNVNV